MKKKTYTITLSKDKDGQVTVGRVNKGFRGFELLGLITHIKNDLEIDLLKVKKEAPFPEDYEKSS
jgi:hypothetical protein